MRTIVETEEFEYLWPLYWTEKEYEAFQVFIAENPNAGDVVRDSGGVRKVRWSRQGSGKSGGVRVIYFNRMANGEIWLILIYAKSKLDSISGDQLRKVKHEIEKTID
ncbi:MAG: RelE toxin of RelE / RelB toxin-antitoxin system [Candidatus Nitrotoga sp. SPKER]|nr:MAG: RelE toxin of RelE / RelB toxin-antitoxin system [Candidatus Nitrotoga sp. SPKER]